MGYDVTSDAGVINLILFWQARAPISKSYIVFVHALDAQNQIVGQQDQIPVSGTYPTTRWVTYEVVRDTYTLHVSETANPPTQTEIGWYDAATRQRVLRADGSDHLVLPLTNQ